jgi:hypothetical protein
MKLHELRLYGTCDSDGALTVKGTTAVHGYLEAVEWIDGDFANGVDAVISAYNTNSGTDNTLLTLTNADNDAWYYPRVLIHSEAGAALTGSSGGDRERPMINGIPRLVVSSGGDVVAGGCILYWWE